VAANTHTRAINAFLRWAHDEGHVEKRVRIPRLKEEQKILAKLTPTDVDHVLRWKHRTHAAHRTHTFACLLLDTGMRADEALSLRRAWTWTTCLSESGAKAARTAWFP
jgi:integrase